MATKEKNTTSIWVYSNDAKSGALASPLLLEEKGVAGESK